MSNKYEDLIKNARMNADCGEHMSPTEVTTLLNVVETTFAALAAEVYDLKHPGTYLPSKRETPATDAFLAEVRAHDLNAFIRHHSAELDAHIKNGGEQFDEKSVRIRDIIVSARLFREQIRKEAAQ
ncbi:Uncharacterised protein [Enterobacter asburiae]|uniref:hypothetical protein n=1 Tax=Enterobacter asburiae TaxID=61645 RepID=UPI00079BADDB|nr:hypothetical protein [Enterobacter asburiae]SAI04776.1 Uncharacterised protein [Enterobacter asburiae]